MIRPVEMQMLLPQTENVGSTQQHENQRVVNENTHAAQEVAKEVKHNSDTVIRKEQNEFDEYKYDAKEKGNGTYQDPRKRSRNKKHSNEEDDTDTKEEDLQAKQPRINIQI